jgi:hypothetical protein
MVHHVCRCCTAWSKSSFLARRGKMFTKLSTTPQRLLMPLQQTPSILHSTILCVSFCLHLVRFLISGKHCLSISVAVGSSVRSFSSSAHLYCPTAANNAFRNAAAEIVQARLHLLS